MDPETSPPAAASPTPAIAPAVVRSSGRRRRRHHDTDFICRRGRLWAAAIFCLLRVLDLSVVLSAYLLEEGNGRTYLLLYVFVTFIWTTALLACIWNRQAWARYVMVGLLVAIPVGELVLLPRMHVQMGKLLLDPVLVASCAVYACIIAMLTGVKSLTRLTSQAYT